MPYNPEEPLRLPKQFDGDGRHGVSGYRGDVIVEGGSQAPAPAAPRKPRAAKKTARR